MLPLQNFFKTVHSYFLLPQGMLHDPFVLKLSILNDPEEERYYYMITLISSVSNLPK